MQLLTVMMCCTHPKRVSQPFIGCVLISHALFSTKVKGFLLQNFQILANQGILFTAYPAADAQFFTLVKLNETSGVVLANVCEVYACAITVLNFLWRKAARGATFQLHRPQYFPYPGVWCGDGSTAVEPISNRELRVFLQLGTVQT